MQIYEESKIIMKEEFNSQYWGVMKGEERSTSILIWISTDMILNP